MLTGTSLKQTDLISIDICEEGYAHCFQVQTKNRFR